MSGKVIDFKEARAAREPHAQGEAKCVCCKHTWQAVAPVGTINLECLNCHRETGAFNQTFMRGEMYRQCVCGNDLFRIHPDGCYCARCGEWQVF